MDGDVIVVGGGLAGLVAAHELVQAACSIRQQMLLMAL